MTTRIAPGVGANLLGQHSAERNQDATTYVGNLDPQGFQNCSCSLWHGVNMVFERGLIGFKSLLFSIKKKEDWASRESREIAQIRLACETTG
ncbi:hypothetical protein COCNU_scaffold026217G000010 [Cocos nucifera]|nr:hypothetical protein [Cocos nucifera]